MIKKLIQKDDVQEYFRLIIKNIAEEVDSEKYEHFFSFESNILKALLKEKKNRKKYEEKDSKDNDFKKANANRDSIFEAHTKKKEDIPEEKIIAAIGRFCGDGGKTFGIYAACNDGLSFNEVKVGHNEV